MSGGEIRYVLSQNAYIKLVLHAIKHRTSAVNGILIGSPLSDSSGFAVHVYDAIPLFHSQIGVLAPLEIALIMIEEYCNTQGLSIVGYFQANERFEDLELGTIARNIGDHIRRYFPHAAVLLLDNEKLEALTERNDRAPVMQIYVKDSSKGWKQISRDGDERCLFTMKEAMGNTILMDCIASERWKDVVDFDDHLDDVSKDWLNPHLFE